MRIHSQRERRYQCSLCGRTFWGHVQADELRVKRQGQIVWLGMVLAVENRLWPGGNSEREP